MFGRYWIWENYFTEEKRDLWQASAQLIRHINKHVIEDMNDFILMKIFKLTKNSVYEHMHQQVKEMKIVKDTDSMKRSMKTMKKKQEKDEFREVEEKKQNEEDKKRTFCVQMRPPYIWNFFGEEEEKIEHLINPKANPEQCYKYEENNRV